MGGKGWLSGVGVSDIGRGGGRSEARAQSPSSILTEGWKLRCECFHSAERLSLLLFLNLVYTSNPSVNIPMTATDPTTTTVIDHCGHLDEWALTGYFQLVRYHFKMKVSSHILLSMHVRPLPISRD